MLYWPSVSDPISLPIPVVISHEVGYRTMSHLAGLVVENDTLPVK